MAVGKGSMLRASRAVKADTKGKSDANVETENTEVKKEPVKTVKGEETNAATEIKKPVAAKSTAKAAASKPAVKKVSSKAANKKPGTVAKANVITSVSEEVLEKVIYQPSSQILDRDANPNEGFGIGDSMPVYYL